MNDCSLRLNGVNNAAIRRVDATTATVDFSPVSKTKILCNTTMPPKCLEVEFSEVRLYGVLRSSQVLGSSARELQEVERFLSAPRPSLSEPPDQ
jgi:hypothetical protein